ncbi:hypothetical protein [Amycolatopsis sp. cmx-4-61]
MFAPAGRRGAALDAADAADAEQAEGVVGLGVVQPGGGDRRDVGV